jgi:PAS domain S-box-containing protein
MTLDPVLTDSGVLRATAALRPEARYKALIDILPDVFVVVFDRDLRVLTLEGGGVARLPMPPETVIGKHLDELLVSEQASQIEPHMRAALRGEPTSFDYETSDGTAWLIQMIPMIDDAGLLSGGMAQWRDVSAQKRAERALAAHAAELERSNAELEQFAYIASHDLSEPLRMINGYLRLLQRRYGDSLEDDAQQFVDFALDGALRMRALIDYLLTYSRLGRVELEIEAVDLQALVESLWRLLTAEREGPAPTLLATGLPVVMGDPGQFAQVFQNLLSNALKFVEPGRAPVVEIRSEPLDDGGWALTLEDEGIGFDPEQAERIFRMFQRLHTRDEFAGTGVGLAIARKVVEAHNGRIWAEVRPGGGARFRIELPVATS